MALLFEMARGIEADEVELDDVEITLVPVSADKAAADDRYSAKMCPQPVELILDAISEMLPTNPKCERRCVKKRPPVPRPVLPAMPRQREHRSAPRGRDGVERDDGGGSDPDGGSGDGDGPGGRSGALRVLERGRRSW